MSTKSSVPDERAAGEEPDHSSLTLFPGETVDLISRMPIHINPWGTRQLVQDVPVLIGRVMGKLAPLRDLIKSGDLESAEIIGQFMKQAAGELISLIAWTAKMTEEEFYDLPAGDSMRIMRAVMRQNKDFFAQLAGLYGDLGVDLGKSSSKLRSSSKGADSP